MAKRKIGKAVRLGIACVTFWALVGGALAVLDEQGVLSIRGYPGAAMWQRIIRDLHPPTSRDVSGVPGNATGAMDDVLALTVRDEHGIAPGYRREAFGQRWSDDVQVEGGHNGCDTRNDVLRRDLQNARLKPNTRGCVVLNGVLQDPYSGQRVSFVRGEGSSALVQVDHVVALADAWISGASAWDEQQRLDFANDPLNLQATTEAENQAKKAKAADAWLPSNTAYACTYVARQAHVKREYGLSVTPQERQRMLDVLGVCTSPPRTPPAIPGVGRLVSGRWTSPGGPRDGVLPRPGDAPPPRWRLSALGWTV